MAVLGESDSGTSPCQICRACSGHFDMVPSHDCLRTIRSSPIRSILAPPCRFVGDPHMHSHMHSPALRAGHMPYAYGLSTRRVSPRPSGAGTGGPGRGRPRWFPGRAASRPVIPSAGDGRAPARGESQLFVATFGTGFRGKTVSLFVAKQGSPLRFLGPRLACRICLVRGRKSVRLHCYCRGFLFKFYLLLRVGAGAKGGEKTPTPTIFYV